MAPLRLSPFAQAGWADASGVEGIPVVSQVQNQEVFLPGRAAAERAADARGFGLAAAFFSSSSLRSKTTDDLETSFT